MTHDTFSLFNTKLLFHTTNAPARRSAADRSARRRLARLLAAASANDALDDAQVEQLVQETAHERRAGSRD